MNELRPLNCAVIIVAAGRGTRAGGEIPKQWQPLGGKRVIDWTLDAFRASPSISQIVVVLHRDDFVHLQDDDLLCVEGGGTRADSVHAGLESLTKDSPYFLLIHVAARSTVPASTISGVISALETSDAAAPGLPVTDALWRSSEDSQSEVAGTADRSGLFRAQTPQGFSFSKILAAHRDSDGNEADDVEVARKAGLRVRITQGHPNNIKITAPEDFGRAERILQERSGTMDIRVGNGFDVHRFGVGDHVMLCGVAIPHGRGLQGHSDADVGLHTITDAIYGALAEGDIGTHFPPSEQEWKGAASDVFLEHAAALALSRGFAFSNVDCTLICEEPKIGPHARVMRERLSQILDLDVSRISVKATTTERLGFPGRREGIAAIATVTLVSR